MEEMQLSYINNVLKDNNNIFAFLDSKKAITSIELSNAIKTELIVFYFFLNKNTLNTPELTSIYEVLNSNNYYLEEDYICSNDLKIYIPDIINLINEYEEAKEYIEDDFYYKTTRVYNLPINSKIIPFDQVCYMIKKTRINHLISDEFIAKDEMIYLNKMKDNTSNFLSFLINVLLHNGDLSSIDDAEIQFIFALVNIFTITEYLEDKIDLDDKCLNISYFKARINKMIYNEKNIQELDNQLIAHSYHYDYINSILNYYQNNVPNAEKTIIFLHRKLNSIMKKEFELGIELIDLKQDSTTFKKNLFTYMIASLKNCTIDYDNTLKDPLVSFFDVEQQRLKCYFDIHLSDLLKIINNDEILRNINNQQKLQKKKKA